MRRLLGIFAIIVGSLGCEAKVTFTLAERGQHVYRGYCTTCHNPDPAQIGSLGPALKGTPLNVLQTKVLYGLYPDGYKPKRKTHVMPLFPNLGPDLPAVAEYLK
jgi:mono/diheme cytochrome c family protein